MTTKTAKIYCGLHPEPDMECPYCQAEATGTDMCNRWEIGLTLTYDVTREDITAQHPGDEEIDFAERSWFRIREHLDQLLANTPFMHYHINKRPVRVWEP